MPPRTSFVFGLVSGIAVISLFTSVGLLTRGAFAKPVGTTTGTVAIAEARPTPAAAPAKTKTPAGKVPEVTDADHIRGNKNANVTFIEYSDFECPFCKRFEPTMQQMEAEYGDRVRIVYRHYPLSFHANAQKEDEASECASELGGNDTFWQYHDAIFERTTSGGTGFALADLVPLAKELGLDESKFLDCLDTGKYVQHVKDDMAGGAAAGVTGTPGSILIDASGASQLAPSVVLGWAVGRIGDFLSWGEFGVPSSLPWAVSAFGTARHPTQIYESLAYLGVFILAYVLRKKRNWTSTPGMTAAFAAFGFALFRFAIDFLRADPSEYRLVSQSMSLAVMCISVIIMKRIRQAHPSARS